MRKFAAQAVITNVTSSTFLAVSNWLRTRLGFEYTPPIVVHIRSVAEIAQLSRLACPIGVVLLDASVLPEEERSSGAVLSVLRQTLQAGSHIEFISVFDLSGQILGLQERKFEFPQVRFVNSVSVGWRFRTDGPSRDRWVLGASALEHLRAEWARSEPQYKLIISDCDGTLWDGLSGEGEPISDSPEAIQIRTFLRRAQERGIHVCLCSKSPLEDVKAALGRLRDPILDPSLVLDFICVNSSKGTAIRGLTDTLQINDGDVLFLDDDIRECTEFASIFPQATTLCVNPQTAERLSAGWLWGTEAVSQSTTASERLRLARSHLARSEVSEVSPFDAAAVLRLCTTVAPMRAGQRVRILELSQRARQWNSRQHVDTARILRAAEAPKTDIQAYVATATDRHGDYGIVGYALTQLSGRHLTILSHALSCRILFKGVENSLILHILQLSADSAESFSFEFSPSERNSRMQRWHKLMFGVEIGQSVPTDRTFATLTAPTPIVAQIDMATGAHSTVPSGKKLLNEIFWAELDSVDAILLASMSCSGSSADPLPQNPTIQAIYHLWLAEGGPPNISAGDDLFSIIQDSLFTANFLVSIEEQMGVSIPIDDLFESVVSLYSLARLVDNARDCPKRPIHS